MRSNLQSLPVTSDGAPRQAGQTRRLGQKCVENAGSLVLDCAKKAAYPSRKHRPRKGSRAANLGIFVFLCNSSFPPWQPRKNGALFIMSPGLLPLFSSSEVFCQALCLMVMWLCDEFCGSPGAQGHCRDLAQAAVQLQGDHFCCVDALHQSFSLFCMLCTCLLLLCLHVAAAWQSVSCIISTHKFCFIVKVRRLLACLQTACVCVCACVTRAQC